MTDLNLHLNTFKQDNDSNQLSLLTIPKQIEQRQNRTIMLMFIISYFYYYQACALASFGLIISFELSGNQYFKK